MIRLLDDALLASRAGSGELAEELVDFAYNEYNSLG
jgi:hypothetical protein